MKPRPALACTWSWMRAAAVKRTASARLGSRSICDRSPAATGGATARRLATTATSALAMLHAELHARGRLQLHLEQPFDLHAAPEQRHLRQRHVPCAAERCARELADLLHQRSTLRHRLLTLLRRRVPRTRSRRARRGELPERTERVSRLDPCARGLLPRRQHVRLARRDRLGCIERSQAWAAMADGLGDFLYPGPFAAASCSYSE